LKTILKKIANASMSEEEETSYNMTPTVQAYIENSKLSSMTLAAERRKKILYPTLTGYGSSCRVEE
jgi:hypothetical protein